MLCQLQGSIKILLQFLNLRIVKLVQHRKQQQPKRESLNKKLQPIRYYHHPCHIQHYHHYHHHHLQHRHRHYCHQQQQEQHHQHTQQHILCRRRNKIHCKQLYHEQQLNHIDENCHQLMRNTDIKCRHSLQLSQQQPQQQHHQLLQRHYQRLLHTQTQQYYRHHHLQPQQLPQLMLIQMQSYQYMLGKHNQFRYIQQLELGS